MHRVPARRDSDGTWWIGTRHGWHLAPVEQRDRVAALAAAFVSRGISRQNLVFERGVRDGFDAEFAGQR